MKNREYLYFPPPNVTGSLHCGHFLVHSVMDYIAKIRTNLFDHPTSLIPGFDHGGIATFIMAQKKYQNKNVKEAQITLLAQENYKNIKNQLMKWHGNFMWDLETYTLEENYKEMVTDIFCKLAKKGLIYRNKMFVNWDINLKTVISDLEVGFKKQQGKLYRVIYQTDNNTEITVATTRPETIFADVALMVNPKDDRYKDFIGKYAYIPLINRKIPILSDNYIDINFGTGVLKITPGHDKNDYDLGKKYNLPCIDLFDHNMNISLQNISEYIELPEDRSVLSVRNWIVKKLNCSYETIIQNIPISTRSRSPIEYCLKNQWFCNMKGAANKVLCQLDEKKIKLWPQGAFDENLVYWLKNIRPWCLSRQISWGHKIPVWFKKGTDDIYKISKKSPGQGWSQTKDRLDTWFSSALWPLFCEKQHNIKTSNVLVTGSDILFFWVARMLMISLLSEDQLPFYNVFLHGLVKDINGLKMSKTKGNVINPQTLIDQYGYDTVRLSMLMQLRPNQTIKISLNKESRVILIAQKTLNKLFNLHKYILGLDIKSMQESKHIENYIGSYIKHYTNQVIHRIYKNIAEDQYNIHRAIDITYDYMYYICSWFVEFSKHIPSLKFALFYAYRRFLVMFSALCPVNCKLLYKEAFSQDLSQYVIDKEIKEDYGSMKFPLISLIQFIRTNKIFHIKLLSWNDPMEIHIVQQMCPSNYGVSQNSRKTSLFGYECRVQLSNDYKKVEKLKTSTLKKIHILRSQVSDLMPKNKKIEYQQEIQNYEELLNVFKIFNY